jgi:hypothetical protein
VAPEILNHRSTSVRTFGEFFEALVEWAAGERNVDASICLINWDGLFIEDEFRAKPLSDETLDAFAGTMRVFLQERVARATETNEYARTLRCGHEFLRGIANTGTDFGLSVDIKCVDVAIVPVEEQLGYAKPRNPAANLGPFLEPLVTPFVGRDGNPIIAYPVVEDGALYYRTTLGKR